MTKITVAKGDGIGPEIMDATLEIILEAGAKIEIEEIEVGEKVYLSGNTSGIAASSWDIIRRNKIFLKAPITTPQEAEERLFSFGESSIFILNSRENNLISAKIQQIDLENSFLVSNADLFRILATEN